jgi:uncharacterized protein YecT (DUF1311 family)
MLWAADAVPAQHMNAKDSPCSGVAMTVELGRCFAQANDSADAKPNSIYRGIMARLGKSDADRLIAAQRRWIEYRDANCLAERALYAGGTAAYPAFIACLEAMTRARTEELQVQYVLAMK